MRTILTLSAATLLASAAFAQAEPFAADPAAMPDGQATAMPEATQPDLQVVAQPAVPDTSMFARTRTVFDNAKISPDLSTFTAALRQTDLARLLGNPGPYTVFAPANGAFANLPDLSGLSRKQLTQLLSYHIVPGKLSVERLNKVIASGNGTATLSTVNGYRLRVTRDGDALVLQDADGHTSRVLAADIKSSNGLLYVVDGLLQPSK